MYLSTAIDGAVIGAWAALFSGVLTHPGEVFAWVPWLYRRAVGLEYGQEAQGWRFALSKPLYACAVCHAGQLALWGYFLLSPRWQFFDHFTFVVVAMFAAHEVNRRIWS